MPRRTATTEGRSKTTLYLRDTLRLRAQVWALRHGTTLSAMVEDGLRLVMGKRESSAPALPGLDETIPPK